MSDITGSSPVTSNDAGVAEVDNLRFHVVGEHHVENSTLLDFTRYYCSATTCPAVIGGVNVYRDISHISKTYMTTMAPYVGAQLERDGLLPKRRR